MKKSFWEFIFLAPSFSQRFWWTVLLLIFIFFIATVLLIKMEGVENPFSERGVSLIGLMIQAGALVLGIFAAHYGLRQLGESRYSNLDNSAQEYLDNGKYSKAYDKWKEAFYIRPEPGMFLNMGEMLVFVRDYVRFDELFIKNSFEKYFPGEIDADEKLVELYLIASRHLLEKNLGEGEKVIKKMIEISADSKTPVIPVSIWDFNYMRAMLAKQNPQLSGECRVLIENMISFLEGTLLGEPLDKFIGGEYAVVITGDTNNADN